MRRQRDITTTNTQPKDISSISIGFGKAILTLYSGNQERGAKGIQRQLTPNQNVLSQSPLDLVWQL